LEKEQLLYLVASLFHSLLGQKVSSGKDKNTEEEVESLAHFNLLNIPQE
jgi:hypothetical protein